MFGLAKERRSFITGSQAYGQDYRTSASDLDLVIFVSDDTLEQLQPFIKETIESTGDHLPYGDKPVKGGRIKMGGIDLILVTDKSDFDRWKKITNDLKARALRESLTREAAVKTFRHATEQDWY